MATSVRARRRPARQATVLRAALALLAMVGDAVDEAGAGLSITAGLRPLVYASVYSLGAETAVEPVILAGIQAVRDVTGVPPICAFDSPDALGFFVETEIAGVPVQVTSRFTTEAGMAAARALLAPAVAA